MPSVQRILANNRNLVLTSALSPSSVRPVPDGVLETIQTRGGSGACLIDGTYTGVDTSVYEVEVVDTSPTTPLFSSPVFSGQGNGTLQPTSFSGTAQTFVFELSDLGKVMTIAGTDLDGAKVVSRIQGDDGNLIHLSVDRSTLVYAATSYSLLNELPKGSDGLTGPEYDWDTKVMGADKLIPVSAHRVSFGDANTGTVYTQYKKYTDGAWKYFFTPAIDTAQPKGTRVKFVTGGVTITVTNGTITEVYTDVVSLYDFLNAIKSSSALLDVDGVVANDRTAGGMAAHDLKTRTDAHALPTSGTGSKYATGFVDVSVSGAAATELIEATCWANSPTQNPNAGLGQELWTLKGSVSGDLGNIKTGVSYTGGTFSLTIPTKLPDGYSGAPRGRFSVSSISYVGRDAEEKTPQICIASMALGPNAVDQTIELEYVKAPDTACACEDIPAPDLSDDVCLTGELTPGGASDMTYTPANVARLTSLYDWVADLVRSHSVYASVSYTMSFIDPLSKLITSFEKTLALVQGVTAGESAWDTVITEFKTDTETALTSSTISAVHFVGWGGQPPLVVGESVSLYLYQALNGRALAPERNTWTYGIGGGSYAHTPWSYLAIRMGDNLSGYSEFSSTHVANYTPETTVQDTVIYTRFVVDSIDSVLQVGTALDVPHVQEITITPDYVVDIPEARYKARMDWVLISAGVSPLGKSDAGSDLEGDGCWQYESEPYYWKVTGSVGGGYADAYTGKPYYSSRIPCGGDSYMSTREFAFQINVGCGSSLKEGDKVTLTIGSAAYPATYEVGDVLTLPIISAADLYLAGGADGDNLQTWHVSGSVTGAMPAYIRDAGTPGPYSGGGLTAMIHTGTIPYAVGDKFSMAVEGGHFKWRKDGGAWSSSLEIKDETTPTALDSGLSLYFKTSAAPSFATGDKFQFKALQPYAVSNCRRPGPERWQWSGSTATLVADLGAVLQLTALAVAYHTLPDTATVTVAGSLDGLVTDWTVPLPYQVGVMSALFAVKSARYLTLTVTSATGGAIGWFWAGQSLFTSLSATVKQRMAYKLDRGAGVNPSSVFHGATKSGELEWSEGALSESDITAIMAMLDHCKSMEDEPVIVYPQESRPSESLVATLLADEIEIPEVWDYQPQAGVDRRYSLKLPFSGVVV